MSWLEKNLLGQQVSRLPKIVPGLLAASALGAYRALEGTQRWIVLGIYALLAAWVLRASFEYLRRKSAERPTSAGGPEATVAA